MTTAQRQRWPLSTFAAIVAHSAFGPRFSGEKYADDGNIATLRTTDISDDGNISYQNVPLARLDEARFAKHFLRPDDLVITRSGRVGTTALFRGYDLPVLPGAFLIRFRLRDGADPRFFRYWFNSRPGRQSLLSVARGVAQQNINITNVKMLKVPVPPFLTQRGIADILSAYDDLIENNRRRIQLLEQASRMIYKEWFVRLRFPGHEHVRIVDGVPEGWDRTTIGEFAPFRYGKALKKDHRVPGAFPVYGSSGIVGTHEKAFVTGPAIIVGRKGNVGSVYWSKDDFHPIDTVYFIEAEYCTAYLYYALLHTPFINTDVAVPGLNRDFAHSRTLLIPDDKTLSFFEDDVTVIHDQVDHLNKHNEALTQARDILLPRLMNGKIDV